MCSGQSLFRRFNADLSQDPLVVDIIKRGMTLMGKAGKNWSMQISCFETLTLDISGTVILVWVFCHSENV